MPAGWMACQCAGLPLNSNTSIAPIRAAERIRPSEHSRLQSATAAAAACLMLAAAIGGGGGANCRCYGTSKAILVATVVCDLAYYKKIHLTCLLVRKQRTAVCRPAAALVGCAAGGGAAPGVIRGRRRRHIELAWSLNIERAVMGRKPGCCRAAQLGFAAQTERCDMRATRIGRLRLRSSKPGDAG